MSSDLDFGSYAPTTPYKALARTTKPKSKGAVAGPSSEPAGWAKRKKQQEASESSGVEEVPGSDEHVEISSDHGNDEEVVVVAPPSKGRKKRKASPPAETATVNGANSGKGKGKAKADPPPKQTRQASGAMDVDDIELIEDLAMIAKPKRTATTRPTKKDTSSKELDRLRRQYDALTAQKDILSQKFDDYSKQRQTEAERILQQQVLQYDAQIKAQEEVINDLNKQLSRTQPLARTGKSSVLHLLTRESADEEKRALEKEIDRLKKARREMDDIVLQKDARIAELEQIEKEARYELKVEQDRIKTLSNSKPLSGLRSRAPGGTLGSSEPKNSEAIRFYEDMTNLLVTNLKIEKGRFFDLDECQLTCVYTYVDENGSSEDKQGKSLNFSLRLYHDLHDPDSDETITSKEQLVKTVHYDPLELDKESPDFVKKLGFLNKPFTFQRPQLPLFLSQIYQRLGGGIVEEDEEEEMEVNE